MGGLSRGSDAPLWLLVSPNPLLPGWTFRNYLDSSCSRCMSPTVIYLLFLLK